MHRHHHHVLRSRLYSWHSSKLNDLRDIAHTRLLSTFQNSPSNLDAIPKIKVSNLSVNEQQRRNPKRSEDHSNVFVNDLSATLEAHRTRNRASVIRKIVDHAEPYFLRPLLPNTGVGQNSNAPVDVRNEPRTAPVRIATQKTTKKRREGRNARKGKDLEYTGKVPRSVGPWVNHLSNGKRDFHSPWLAYMEGYKKGYFERSVTSISNQVELH